MTERSVFADVPFVWYAGGGLVLLWLWRAITLGRQIGEITQEVKQLRSDVTYLRNRIDKQ